MDSRTTRSIWTDYFEGRRTKDKVTQERDKDEPGETLRQEDYIPQEEVCSAMRGRAKRIKEEFLKKITYLAGESLEGLKDAVGQQGRAIYTPTKVVSSGEVQSVCFRDHPPRTSLRAYVLFYLDD